MHCHTPLGQSAVEILQCSTTLLQGSGQWKSCNVPPHCLGAVVSGPRAMHCHTAWGKWVTELPQFGSILSSGSGRCNSCAALPRCLW